MNGAWQYRHACFGDVSMDTGTLRIYTYARGISYTRRVLVESHKCTADMARVFVANHRSEDDPSGFAGVSSQAFDYVWRADSVIL